MAFFTTIRFKILAAVCLLVVLPALALRMVGKDLFANYKNLQIEACRSVVAEAADDLAATIQDLQANARELAIMGELLLPLPPTLLDESARYAVEQNFQLNAIALGGGIWYAPFLFDKNRELACVYAFKDNGSLRIDQSFAGREYHYPTQAWYQNAKKLLKEGGRADREVVWSAAYVDATGSRTLMTTVCAGIYGANDQFLGLATIDWSFDDIGKKIASIRPTPHSEALFADSLHDVVFNFNGPETSIDLKGKSPRGLPWYDENAPEQSAFARNGQTYISFAKKFDNGMIMIVNVPEDDIFYEIDRMRILDIVILVFAMLLAASLTWFLLNRSVSRPVARLCKAAACLGSGDLDVDFSSSSRDELGSLARSFSTMTQQLKQHIAHIGQITAEKERVTAELRIARDIQAAMLPAAFPQRQDCALYATMKPAREVGGDFYDFFFIGANRIALIMADVSDKGVPAALFMAIAKTLISNSLRNCADPGKALTMANAQLCENNRSGMFVTAFAGVLDLRSGNFCCANAGHNPFYIHDSGDSFRPVALPPGLPLAVMEDTRFATVDLALDPGATIFLYTDGLTEAANAAGQFWGISGLEKALAAGASRYPENLPALVGSILDSLRAFTKGIPQSDDITMLALIWKFSWQEERVFPAHISALPDFMAFLQKSLDRGNFRKDQRLRFAVAAEEIFVNIASHAYAQDHPSPQTRVMVGMVGSTLCLRLVDAGKAFNPLKHRPPDIELPANARLPGGLGIFMALKGASHIAYARRDGKNILTMFLYAENLNECEIPDGATS